MRKSRNLWESFKFATMGILYAIRTQRNMRIHLGAGLLIWVFANTLQLETYEFFAVIFAIVLVMITEMINTAVEAAVDMFTQKYHPLAQTAKDVAAGAVFIAAINAMIVGYFVFIKSGRLLGLLFKG